MRGIEPRAFHMQSERSTTELHPLCIISLEIARIYSKNLFTVDHMILVRLGCTYLSSMNVYGHIMLKAPVLVRSLKLSNIESR